MEGVREEPGHGGGGGGGASVGGAVWRETLLVVVAVEVVQVACTSRSGKGC
jgi:hypothetical protein